MTHIPLVIHTEALKFPYAADKLEGLGKEINGAYRPVLAVVTPLNPMYHTDPLKDPTRTLVERPEITDAHMKRFEENLSMLSQWFDIGYHGHYFKPGVNGYIPEISQLGATTQFLAEVNLLRRLGYKCETYAGGWWHLSQEVAMLLELNGFKVDTTVNSERKDSFDRLQYGRHLAFGRPGYLTRNVMEIQTQRRVYCGLTILDDPHKFYAYSFHDYDLMLTDYATKMRIRFMLAQCARSKSKSISEALETALVVA